MKNRELVVVIALAILFPCTILLATTWTASPTVTVSLVTSMLIFVVFTVAGVGMYFYFLPWARDLRLRQERLKKRQARRQQWQS
jgi:hypothetical protein